MTRYLIAALLLAGCASSAPAVATPPPGTTTTTVEVEAARTGEQLLSAAGQPLHTPRCGTERWVVKIGIDREAGHVHTDSQPTTVAALASQHPPAVLPPGDRVEPAENNLWAVAATVVKVKVEADRDYHLVLADGGQTMIAEIPDPRCLPASDPWLPLVTVARHQLDAYHIGSKWVTINRRATITGVEFFDTIHGQDGVAVNGVELHPVLGLVWQ